MKNVAHYQSGSQTMNTTTCLILITATLLAAAKGFEVGNPPWYHKIPAPASEVILVSCDNVVELNIESKKIPGGKFWFLEFNPDKDTCHPPLLQKFPVDRSLYKWRRASLPVEISSIGQQFVIITPEEFKDGGWLWVGSQ